MSSPFIFIATNRLKPGQLERERKRVPGLLEFIEANEPRLIAFNEYVGETGDEVTVVQVHPDAASMEAHMEIVRERALQAYADTLDATVRIQVFGHPTDAILETPANKPATAWRSASTASTSAGSPAQPPDLTRTCIKTRHGLPRTRHARRPARPTSRPSRAR
jgi:hypothetical protein